MKCSDCCWAVVKCKIYGKDQRIQTSKTDLTICCKKGRWLVHGGHERVYRTLGAILEPNGILRETGKSCPEFKESQVPVGTWQE